MEIVELDEAAAEGSDEDALVPSPAPALGPQHVEAEVYVKDAGMMLVTTVAPDFTWQSGNADIAIRCAFLIAAMPTDLPLTMKYFDRDWTARGNGRGGGGGGVCGGTL